MSVQESEVILLPEQDAGGSFRAEMFFKNMLMGYWKYLVGVVGLGLLGVLLFGMRQNAYIDSQKKASAERGKVVAQLKTAMPEDFNPSAPSEAGLLTLKKSAQALEAVGGRTEGMASAESYLQAADFFRLAGDVKGQRRAYEGALNKSKADLVQFGVAIGLANLDNNAQHLEQKNLSGANLGADRLEKAQASLKGIYAQRVALARAEVLESWGQDEQARAVYVTFLSTWPSSEFNSQVQERLSMLSNEPSP